jgi:glyoxylase-like metal-dependent hydrolase (beta-lactamase superfamily II)
MPSPYTFTVGDFTCSVVADDGATQTFESLAQRFPEAPAGALDAALRRRHPSGAMIDSHNALLIQTPEGVVLADTGNPAERGNVAARVAEVLPPEQVDVVVLTHGHGDHVGGLLDLNRELAYPSARYVMHRDEWPFLMGPGGRYDGVGDDNVLRLGLLAIEPRLTLVEGETEVLPGVWLLPAPGHTPGHMALLLESRGERLLDVVDAIHYPVQLDEPAWSPKFDADTSVSVPTRRALLGRAADERLLTLIYHFSFPGLGYVERQGAAFTWWATV